MHGQMHLDDAIETEATDAWQCTIVEPHEPADSQCLRAYRSVVEFEARKKAKCAILCEFEVSRDLVCLRHLLQVGRVLHGATEARIHKHLEQRVHVHVLAQSLLHTRAEQTRAEQKQSRAEHSLTERNSA